MVNTADLATCLASDGASGELLPLSPFYALRYHFGMLLGVDDFETEQAYHRAKIRLHNAWLHREGVVWGFNVTLDHGRHEIRVKPGLALDAAGHELHLEADACVNIGEWFAMRENDPGFEIKTDEDGGKTFDAHVVIRFKACLTRQVPALLEPCDNGSTGTAYSRVFETVEILLLPNLSPPRAYPYHRLRLMFGLDEPNKEEESGGADDDQAVLEILTAIQELPKARQTAAYLKAFHRFAALDGIDLRPATSEDGARTLLFPGRDNDLLVLADIAGIKLAKQNGGWTLAEGAVDTSVRPSHVATSTLQDLLAALIISLGAQASLPARVPARTD
jgi:hypothetical protein